jgi:secretion/DNA translocation related TadE-like protein
VTPDDRGVATVWTAAFVAILIGAAAFVYWAAVATATRHRAESAADLAALAAAGHAVAGPLAACERARQIAVRMSATLLTCRWDRGDALVEVRSPLPGELASWGAAEARARAGPVVRPG